MGVGVLMSAVDDMELLNVFIDPDQQGRGLGRYLVSFLLNESQRAGKACCYLEVRRSNVVAQRVYKRLGFSPVGLRKAYYPSVLSTTLSEGAVREDAIVMACWLGDISVFDAASTDHGNT